jgi:hypothetical protein
MRQLYALILGTALSAPSLALAATPSEVGQRPASHAVVTSGVTSSSAQPQAASQAQDAKKADRARYAEKEAKSGDAKEYRGGDTVVIGASAAVAILAVILILVII